MTTKVPTEPPPPPPPRLLTRVRIEEIRKQSLGMARDTTWNMINDLLQHADASASELILRLAAADVTASQVTAELRAADAGRAAAAAAAFEPELDVTPHIPLSDRDIPF